MGVVYVAEDTHLKRRVALKFLSSLDRPYRARFLREAQAVSRLSHPNIATVFDYGETPDGQPYIVMELVEGKTLHDLLLEGCLSISETVRITALIGEALGEAHRMGIVHRDVKPSNVVITPRGSVKVLDFGLAKLLDEYYGDEASGGANLLATRTQSSVVVGTPLYLSPEQATGKALDGRSDLFALGAILYECLTGQSAFSGGSAIEIGAQIIHFTPPVPSRLNPHVPVDLDRITMKALQKNVEHRYQSAAELVADLNQVAATLGSDGHRVPRREYSSAAVTAPHPSAITTIAEAIRRPRLSLATLAIVILVSALLVWGFVRLTRPAPYQPSPTGLDAYNKGTDALRNGAYLQATIALQQAVDADPGFALAHARLAEAFKALDYSDRAKDELLIVGNLVPDRSQLPRVDSLYLEAINNVVTRNFPGAIKSYREIAKLQPNEARAFVDLGRAYENNSENDRAIENYVKATTLDPQYPTAYLRAGTCYSRKGDVASAATALDKAEVLFRTLRNVEGISEVLRQRGLLFQRSGRFDEAKAQLDSALSTAQATNNEPQIVHSLFEQSYFAFTRGRLDEAQRYAQQAIELARDKHLEALLSGALTEVGNMYRGRGDFGQAETYFKDAINAATSNKQKRFESVAKLNLGGLYIHQLRTDEGMALVEQARQYFESASFQHEVLLCLTEIARGHRRKGNYDAALKVAQDKLERAKQTGNQPQVAFTYGEIGSILIEAERYSEALQNYDISYNLHRSLENQLMIAYNQHNRGNILWRLGEPQKAREALEESFKVASENGYKALLPEIEVSYAEIALSDRNFRDAAKHATSALAQSREKYPNVVIEAKYTLGLAKVFSGDRKAGLTLCNEAAAEATSLGDNGLISRSSLAHLEALLEADDASNALTIAKQAGERLAHHAQYESLWRALVFASRASEKLGDAASASSYRERAKEALEKFQQSVGHEVFKNYLMRSDIKIYYSKLG